MKTLAHDPVAQPEQIGPAAKPSSIRMSWIDNLRTGMILLVINCHACVTYSHVGSWFYMADPEPTMGIKVPFALWLSHLQSFFMGILFFIAGYFAQRSLARKRPGEFVAERMIRLGIPTLIFMFLIFPFILLVLHSSGDPMPPVGEFYRDLLLSGRFLGATGPMWFAFFLLILSLAILPFRQVLTARSSQGINVRVGNVIVIAIGIGLASFLVRLGQPIGSSVINFQFCFFSQYLVAFGLGIWFSRRNALEELAMSRLAVRAGWLALILGPVTFIAMFLLGGTKPELYFGGWHPQALALAVWEQLTGFGLALGAIAFFRRKLNRDDRWLLWMSRRSFPVYVIHAPILVWLAQKVPPFGGPFVMAGLLTVAGAVVSFAVADVVVRIPVVNRVL